MDLEDFREKIEEGLFKKASISFFCSCEITYSGRAEAFLAKGDRIILIKNDNTVVVHQPEGSAAINYMRAGSKVEFFPYESNFMLKCTSPDGKEFLEVMIFKAHGIISYRLEDGQKQELAGNEKDMSDMIKDNPKMISPDFIPLSREEHTKFGFIDVFGHDGAGNMIIVECKRYTAGLDAVTQLRRYVEKIMELKGIKNVKGILAAPSISPNSLEMMQKWGFEFISINPPKRHERFNKDQKTLGHF